MTNDQKKQSLSIYIMIASGIILIAIVTFALVRTQKAPQSTSQPQETKSPAEQPAGEQAIPDPAEPIASIQEESPDFRVPAFHENVETLQLPPVKDPSTVPADARAAYVVVKDKPKLIAQLPCFCYCERWGHGSLHDCFTTDHAVTCDICMNEALQADQLDRQGMSAPEIRETIVAQFRKAAAEEDHSDHEH